MNPETEVAFQRRAQEPADLQRPVAGELADVVHLARFLLSEEAAFITGQTLVVDGGLTS